MGADKSAPARQQSNVSVRSTAEVLRAHLDLSLAGDTEADIAQNYSPDVVLLTGVGVLRGHDGVRQSREFLAADIPDATFEIVTEITDGRAGFIEWTARAESVTVDDGADSFLIESGLIVIQTIHYTVRHRIGYHQPLQDHERHAGVTQR